MLCRKPVVALLLFLCAAAALAADTHFVVVAPVANMYRTASTEADVVSQAIYSSDVVQVEAADGWVKIRTGDEYTGWVPQSDLKLADKPYGTAAKNGKVAALFASVYREPNVEIHQPLITIPFEARLEITGDKQLPDGSWYSVKLPDGASGWIQSGDVSFDDKPLSISAAIALARRFIGLPYRWGGTSSWGYDCSGFTQMLVRSRGAMMPRDASVQAKWDGSVPVERADLQPGDLLYFGSKPPKINHTAMYIGNGQFIHATRHDRPVVQISCLDDAPWTTLFIAARRLK